jgi:hypothetical protein
LKQRSALLRCEPISNPHPQPFGPLDPPDTGGKFRTKKSSIRRLIGETAHRSEANVDGRGSEILLLQIDSISKNNGAIEGKARL